MIESIKWTYDAADSETMIHIRRIADTLAGLADTEGLGNIHIETVTVGTECGTRRPKYVTPLRRRRRRRRRSCRSAL